MTTPPASTYTWIWSDPHISPWRWRSVYVFLLYILPSLSSYSSSRSGRHLFCPCRSCILFHSCCASYRDHTKSIVTKIRGPHFCFLVSTASFPCLRTWEEWAKTYLNWCNLIEVFSVRDSKAAHPMLMAPFLEMSLKRPASPIAVVSTYLTFKFLNQE